MGILPDRFEWSEIAIVGCVGGLASGVLTLAYRFGATTDNLLNFLGGAVGSGLAVAATLWLERRRRARAFRQLLDSLVIVADASMRFRSISEDLSKPMILTLQQSMEALEASRLGTVIENPLHQYGFHSAMFWLKRSAKEMQDLLVAYDGGKMPLAELHDNSKKSATRIVGPIEDFLSMQQMPKAPLDALAYCKARRELEVLKSQMAGGATSA